MHCKNLAQLKRKRNLRQTFCVAGKVQWKPLDVPCATVAAKIMHHLGFCKLCIHGSFGAVIIFARALNEVVWFTVQLSFSRLLVLLHIASHVIFMCGSMLTLPLCVLWEISVAHRSIPCMTHCSSPFPLTASFKIKRILNLSWWAPLRFHRLLSMTALSTYTDSFAVVWAGTHFHETDEKVDKLYFAKTSQVKNFAAGCVLKFHSPSWWRSKLRFCSYFRKSLAANF